MQEILKKLKEHDERFDRHDEQFDVMARTLADHTEQLDRITEAVTDHTGRLDRMDQKLEQLATKEDISKITNTLDKVVKLYETRDQELTILTRDVRKIEEKVEKNTKDIQKLMPAFRPS